MNNEIKREMEKIEIPKELDTRVEMGIKRVKLDGQKNKKYPRWIIGAAASIMIMGATFPIYGSYIADATDTLIGKIFGSDKQEQILEVFPEEEAHAYFKQMERHLELAKEHLSAEEFEDYSQLMKDMTEISMERASNPNADWEELDNRSNEIQKEIDKYGIGALTIHTLEEAQAMVNYPIKRPAYIPDGYVLVEERAQTSEEHVGEDPVVVLQYQEEQGEFNFYTTTEKIDKSKEDELKSYDHIDSYELDGYAFEHAYGYKNGLGNVQGMKVIVPEEGYEIIMHAAMLSKEEMEKVLLSMVE
ncbi:DUF4367 domain-containing protein [Bacillus sp. FJAT-50079]|uniref:DUF4367 domain-containing protein n=1 Tax=Bacillus sp. FJAT-50079 TaxID=2833577 RepID=UPI001BC943DF|nr:DUF4367 domain-containing protein [Bacillus sp. FJAT-50079]MBS4210453.1 DUF4367 domain-containing protein [Bacillus sp. FJAT-50079]